MRSALLSHRRSIAPLFLLLIAACSSDDPDTTRADDDSDANLPERASVSGSSFTNADAQSSAFEPAPEDVEVTATGFEDEVSVEITEVIGAQQNP